MFITVVQAQIALQSAAAATSLTAELTIEYSCWLELGTLPQFPIILMPLFVTVIVSSALSVKPAYHTSKLISEFNVQLDTCHFGDELSRKSVALVLTAQQPIKRTNR